MDIFQIDFTLQAFFQKALLYYTCYWLNLAVGAGKVLQTL